MKTLRLKLAIPCLALCLLLAGPAHARRVRKGDTVKIDFDPALEGGAPALRLNPIEDAPQNSDLFLIESYAWENNTRMPLHEETVPGNTPYTLSLLTRNRPDILGVRVTKTGDKEPMAEWRALYLHEGRPLDYAGSPRLKRPDDFDAYWNIAQQRLADVPMNPRVQPVPEKDTATGRLFRVTLDSWNNTPIVCWYFVPRDADPLTTGAAVRKFPAIQIMPGWGAEEPPVDRTADGYITLSMNPRAHGPSKEFFTTPVNHHLWNIDNPEEYYYRAAFMDCVRGLDFLASRPEVAADRIGVEGGSQGGAFALAMGSLDTRVACVVSNVPYIVNFPDFTELSTLGSGSIFGEYSRRQDIGERVRDTLAYIDIANLVPNIKAPTQVTVGLQDPVCPPLNGIVAVNRIPGSVPKELFIDPEAEHEVSEPMRKKNKAWFERHLKP